MAAQPTQPIYNDDGSYSGPDSPASQYGDFRNPLGIAKLINSDTRGYNFLGNIFAEITPVKHLVFKTIGGIDFKTWQYERFAPKYAWKPIPQRFQSAVKTPIRVLLISGITLLLIPIPLLRNTL